ncbi:tRNA 2-thiouridine(34) synthase MnmA [Thermodesulfovibrio yellowstonii]|uniref:tRNA 2-thiouridine(34) synthase MnmA n=1 Tax=Thermodesulfovibrio yellowstonii TaxID=28262 RepID=UPI003C797F7B
MEKVLLAMSGGIDSSVAAYLLREKGMAVEGVFFILFDEPANIELATQTANFLNIKLHIEDLREKFKADVITPFFEGYKKGITPNPCVICNRKIKFPSLKFLAEKVNANYIATGHYARIVRINNIPLLMKGIDPKKDQSYFLYGIERALLSHIIFPLGEYTKYKIREIAEKVGIPSKVAEESTEVCFLRDKRYYESIRPTKGGPIIEMSTGKIIGQHRGIHLYTIGQRKRLGIASPHPLYVVKIEPSENAVYVDSKEKAFMREFVVNELNWLCDIEKKEFSCQVKIRYAMNPEKATVTLINKDRAKVVFEKPQFAPTPGQSAVFYNGDIVLGGGVIKEIMQGF